MGKTIISRPVTSSGLPIDSSFVTSQYDDKCVNLNSQSHVSPHTAMSHMGPEEELDDGLTPGRSRKGVPDFSLSFDQETQYTVHSENRSIRQCLNHIYKELSENRALIQKLGVANGSRESTGERQVLAPHEKSCISRYSMGSDLEQGSAQNLEYSSYDVLLDYISNSSPDGYFEQSSSFYPEQYTMKGLFSDPIFVIGITQSEQMLKTQKYFLLYAETPRRWRRITVSATFDISQDQSAILRARALGNLEVQIRLLPKLLSNELHTLLPRLELFKSVTSLSLLFREDESGQIVYDSTKTKICEDIIEVEMFREQRILNDLKHLNCEQFLERDILVESRMSSSRFKVRAGSRTCVERKVPFVNSGTQGENEFHAYFQDLKHLKSMRGYKGVAEFIGVVVDDTRSHLRSYLYEYPVIGSLFTVLMCAGSKSETIPWSVREKWAQQIVEAVSEVHSKGLLVGCLMWLHEIGIRADGRIVLAGLRTSQKHFANYNGHMAPELRDASRTDTYALNKMVNCSTEIFQLGFILWKIAEQKSNVFPGYFCSKSRCTYRPRYKCTADHANPVELPTCPVGIPSYFNDLITQCRLSDPHLRPTAYELAEIFSRHIGNYVSAPASLNNLLQRYACPQTFYIWCIECGTLMTDIYYHCDICYQANFDLCQACAAQDICCFDPQHRLMKKTVTSDGVIQNTPD